MNHRIGRGKVEANPARFQADQKDGQLAGLEFAHRRATVAGTAGQQGIGYAAALQLGFDQGQHARELGKQQDSTPLGKQLFQHVQQGDEFT
ncbi:hypothetical protein D3C77_675440 [compost metagenome]